MLCLAAIIRGVRRTALWEAVAGRLTGCGGTEAGSRKAE